MNYTGKEYTVYPQMDSVYATDIHSVKLVVPLCHAALLSLLRPSITCPVHILNQSDSYYTYRVRILLSKECELVFNKKFLSQMARL